MGCPVKKVCNSWCGSALLQHETLVARILEAVVEAVRRAGHAEDSAPAGTARTRMRCASRASPKPAGIAMLTLHGRTRGSGYKGDAEYETIAAVKAAVRIPVVANGDIDSPEKAKHVLAVTGADAIMIGRAAQGRPWIFREIDHFLRTGEHLPPPRVDEVRALMNEHLHDHYAFYGEYIGVRTARKHIGWYVRDLPGGEAFRQRDEPAGDCDRAARGGRSTFSTRCQARRTGLQYRRGGATTGWQPMNCRMNRRALDERNMSKDSIAGMSSQKSLESYFKDLGDAEADDDLRHGRLHASKNRCSKS